MMVFFRTLLREFLIALNRIIQKIYGYDIAKSAKVSLGAKLDKTNAKGVHIGEESYIASGARILTHDYCRAMHSDVYIGKRCFIGADSIILPGVKLPDMTIVAAGAIVTKTPNSLGGVILAGNPAKIIREGIVTGKYGQIHNGEDFSQRG